MALHKTLPDYNISDWGWMIQDDAAVPIWGTLPSASEACSELLRCNCKLKCSNRCKCRKNNLRCTELCACDAGCDD